MSVHLSFNAYMDTDISKAEKESKKKRLLIFPAIVCH